MSLELPGLVDRWPAAAPGHVGEQSDCVIAASPSASRCLRASVGVR
jgi:hypothetical protein